MTQGEKSAAILLIHGIGEQRPYETIDAFVQGLGRRLKITPGRLEHRLTMCGDRVTTSVRIDAPEPVGRFGTRFLDVYEFHWAGMVEGKIRLHQVLRWLVIVALTPLRLWSYQATLPAEAGAKGKGLPFRFLVGELLRSSLLLLVALLIVGPFVYAAFHWGLLRDVIKAFWAGFLALKNPGGWALLGTTVLIAGSILLGYVRLGPWLRASEGTERTALSQWRNVSAIAVVFLGILAALIRNAFRLDVLGFVRGIWVVVTQREVALALGLGWLAFLLSGILVKYVGDIALYTTADENSSFFRTRTKILEGATMLLQTLCDDPTYEGVYVAGHSLGSVIGYDCINRVVRDARVPGTEPAAGRRVSRIRGLLTFGSPLDTVYYFFRTVVSPGQPVRAQVLSSLHAFRKKRSGRDYGPFQFARYELPKMDDFTWLNVYSPTDPVSRRLVFYQVDRQESRAFSPNPVDAHLAYWSDDRFYQMVSEWL